MGYLPPLVHKDRVYVGTGAGCAALDLDSGKSCWLVSLADLGGCLTSAPVWAGGTLVAGTNSHLIGMAPVNGRILWSVQLTRFGYFHLAVDHRGLVYASSGTGELLCADPVGGGILFDVNVNDLPEAWGAPQVTHFVKGSGWKDLGALGSPSVDGNDLFVGTESGLVLAFHIPPLFGAIPKTKDSPIQP